MGFTTRVSEAKRARNRSTLPLFWDKYGTFLILAIIVAIFGSLSHQNIF